MDQGLEHVLRGVELRLPEVIVTWLCDVPSHVVLREVGDAELLLHGGIIESFKPRELRCTTDTSNSNERLFKRKIIHARDVIL